MTAPDDGADRLAVAFAGVLRASGLDVPIGSTVTFAQALGAVGLDRRTDVYWAGRATLVCAPEDAEVYDRAFNAFWHGIGSGVRADDAPTAVTIGVDHGDDPDHAPEGSQVDEAPIVSVRWSPAEVLRHRDFAAYTHDELPKLVVSWPTSGLWARGVAHAGGARPLATVVGPIFVGRCVARCAREASPSTARSTGRRSVRAASCLLCDVSGSMEPYARALLRFLQAAVVGGARVEAFALGTRLTRITRELSSRDPDAALDRSRSASHRLVGWHPAGGRAPRVQRRLGHPRNGAWSGRRDPLGWLGPRRSDRAGRRDGSAPAGGLPHRLGEPAQGNGRLRAARAAWPRRSRTSTTSSPATRSRRSRSSSR